MEKIRGQRSEVREWVPADLRAGTIADAIADGGPTYYPVYCPWCLAEGVRYRVAWSTCEHSSGICVRHSEELMREATQLRPPGYAAARGE